MRSPGQCLELAHNPSVAHHHRSGQGLRSARAEQVVDLTKVSESHLKEVVEPGQPARPRGSSHLRVEVGRAVRRARYPHGTHQGEPKFVAACFCVAGAVEVAAFVLSVRTRFQLVSA